MDNFDKKYYSYYISKIRNKSLRNITGLICLLSFDNLKNMSFKDMCKFIESELECSQRCAYDYAQSLCTIKDKFGCY